MAKKKSTMTIVWICSTCIALSLMAGGFYLIQALLKDDGQKRRRQIQTVHLLKPPPPPKIKEKPPEPEIKKKEEIIEQKPEEKPEEAESPDEPPPGNDLGLDAEGTAGSDGFGLKANKGGRALIGGGGKGSLLRKYAWYTRIVQDELRRQVQEHLDENGGLPEGTHKALVRIEMDREGVIVHFELVGLSGNSAMDEAVRETLKIARISEPPPEGMPRTMKIRISSRG